MLPSRQLIPPLLPRAPTFRYGIRLKIFISNSPLRVGAPFVSLRLKRASSAYALIWFISKRRRRVTVRFGFIAIPCRCKDWKLRMEMARFASPEFFRTFLQKLKSMWINSRRKRRMKLTDRLGLPHSSASSASFTVASAFSTTSPII